MIYKACKTCKFYEENVEKEEIVEKDRLILTLSTAECTHELSEGKTSSWMIYRGPCGRDLKLWKRKPKVYDDIETPETD